jgi:hypothetical protein
MGLGLIAIAAARLAKRGKGLHEVMNEVEQAIFGTTPDEACSFREHLAFFFPNTLGFPFVLFCIFLSRFRTIGVLTISLAIPARRHCLSRSAASVLGLISSLATSGH